VVVLDGGERLDLYGLGAGVQNEVLLYHLLVLFEYARIAVCNLASASVSSRSLGAFKEFALHGSQYLLLFLLQSLEGFVDVVLHPAEVLLSGVAEREDILKLSEDVVLKFFD